MGQVNVAFPARHLVYMVSMIAWAICAALPLAPLAEAAEEKPVLRFLNAPPTTDGTMTYAVSTGVNLLLPFAGTRGSTLELYLLPFLGEHGDGLSIEPSIEELPRASMKDQRLSFAVDRPVLTLRLKVPALPTAGKYIGGLVVVQEGEVRQSNRIVLTRALAQRPAKVTVDARTLTLYEITSDDPASFKLQARNASAEWQVDGVFLRLLDVAAPAGANFDPARNLKLTWNDKEAADLWRSPSGNSPGRSIAPNQQAEIGGKPVGLQPGEYTVKLGLGAANATLDNDQPITLKLFVRDPLWIPVAVLLFAILMSYLATKGLEAQRRRAAQLKKVAEIRRAWLRDEPSPLPAVAARAILKQVEDRNRKWLGAFFGQDATTSRTDKAELLVKILDRVRSIRSRIKTAAWPALIRRRANKRLTAITDSLDPDTVDDNAGKRVDAELAVLEQWFDAKELDGAYWLALKSELDNLISQTGPETFKEHGDLVEVLRKDIDAVISKGDPKGNALREVEETYAKLKVLWERNQAGDYDSLKKLGDLLKPKRNMNIEEFFRAADGIAWSGLQTAEFKFVTPDRNEVDPPDAYQLIRFEIAPTDPRLGNNYLFKHKVEYDWVLYFKEEDHFWSRIWTRIWKKPENKMPLTQPITMEPRLVQYVPRAGTLYVSVGLRYLGGSSDNAAVLVLRIQRSSEYGVTSAFRFTEVAALVIATLFALVSGLAAYYFGKHGFGSIGDYIALFLWGAGVDQTKNFLQNLERTSGRS